MADRSADNDYLGALNAQIGEHYSALQTANYMGRVWFDTRPMLLPGELEIFFQFYPPEHLGDLLGIPYPGEDRDYPSLWDCVIEAVECGLDHAREERDPAQVFIPEHW